MTMLQGGRPYRTAAPKWAVRKKDNKDADRAPVSATLAW
jgi:hypothetical protein